MTEQTPTSTERALLCCVVFLAILRAKPRAEPRKLGVGRVFSTSQRSLSRRRALGGLACAVLAPWPLRATGQHTTESDSFGQLVADFGRLTSLAYAQVSDLKALHAKSKSALAQSEVSYKKAKRAADTWLDVARASVAGGRGKVDAKALQLPTKDLQDRVNELVNLAQISRAAKSSNEGRRNPALISAVSALIASIADLGLKVFESWTKADDKVRAAVVQELERLRWMSFSDI